MVHKFQLIGKEEEIYKLFSTYICQLINNDFSLNYYDYEIRTNTFKKILTMSNFVTEEKRHEALSLTNLHFNSGNAIPDPKNYQNKSFSMPIKNGDELIGRLDVIFTANPASIEELNILNRVVDDFALAISNIRLRNHLNNLSIHDALTNLYNRHYLDNVVNQVLLKAKRNKYKVCFIIIDIDFFKKFNDSFGHEIGDVILKKFGHYIRNFFRETDLVFRYGGEEFLIILENISFNNSLLRINQFRDFIKENPFDLKNKKHILSFSAGAAFYHDHGEDFDSLVSAADKALYRAKKTGRNRVCFAELDLVT